MAKSKGKRKVLSSCQSQGPEGAKRSRQSRKVYNEDNLLCELLTKAGLTLMDGEETNELNVTKAVFQKQLETAVRRHVGDLSQTVEEFTRDFKEYISDGQRFHKCLHPCVFSESCESAQASAPETTIRLLLGVDLIQSPLMTMLLSKLKEFVDDMQDHIMYQGQRIYIPRLLLSQFRFLDRIVDGKELSASFQDVLSTPSTEVQKEVMACIPDVVEDSEHEEMAKRLRQELIKNKDLTCPVIDALTYLNISHDAILEVRFSILEMLKSFSPSDLPIVVKFLLESVTTKDALDIINDMRSGICLTPKNDSSPEELEKVRTSVKLSVDAIKGRMQFHHYVAEAWIKAVDTSSRLHDVDLFVLLILHSINHRKAVESLIRNKIRSGVVSPDRLAVVFKTHSQVLREYLSPILKLAQALLRSVETPISIVGSCLYKMAFISFEAYSRQEVVGNLITHIGSGFNVEVDASLQILNDLLKENMKAMSRFAVFLKGVLDYLDHNNLSVNQIGTLYFILARLAFHTQQDGSFLQNELHIIVRKQLTSTNPKYKRMGVMGAISLVSALACQDETNKGKGSAGPSQPAESTSMDKERYKEVVSLMNLVETSIRHEPEMCGLFLDGLACVVKGLHLSLKDWLCDHMTSAFEENFVSESAEGTSLPVKSTYNLNDEEESSIAIDLLPLVEKMLDKSQNQELGMVSPLCLSPLFRLVTVCQRDVSGGSLEDIDALLGCPLFMPDGDIANDVQAYSQKEKDVVCNSLFLCINWFREVLNSFAPMDTVEMKGKVLQRLKHITELMSTLKKCLASNPSFIPPPCLFDCERSSSSSLIPSVASTKSKSGSGADGKKKGGKGGKKSSKKKVDASVLTESSQLGNGDDEANSQIQDSGVSQSKENKENKEGSSSNAINMADYRQHFRELDFSVFSILKTGHISQKQFDTNLNTETTEELKIELPHLQFLLEDLSSKLSHFLTSTSYRRTFFKTRSDKNEGFSNLRVFTPTQIAAKTVKLLPHLCDHLEGTCAFFQMQMDENDGLRDGPNAFSEEACLTASCYQLLLQCIMSVFSWNGFSSASNQDIITSGLMVAAGRITTSTQSRSLSQKDYLECAFRYFSNFSDTIPNIDTAVCLIKLLTVLAHRQGVDGNLKQELGSAAGKFLSMEWRGDNGEKPKGVKFNENLQTLLKCLVTCNLEPLEVLESVVTKGMLSVVKDNECQEFPSLTRVTFSVFYKVVLQELVNCVKKIPVGKKNDADELNEDRMLTWSLAVKVLHLSISLIKVIHTRSCLGTVLKCGRQFVEVFLSSEIVSDDSGDDYCPSKDSDSDTSDIDDPCDEVVDSVTDNPGRSGMPLMDKMFRRHHSTVERLLKTLQQSTRTMHHLCGHSKIVKDVSLTNQVPMLKKALEAFVYRVKAMLSVNNCENAFWMGNLKNKNLQGEEILSQTQQSQEEEEAGDNEEEEDENGDDDDNDSEVEMTHDNEDSNASARTGSYSEVF